ncbi:hypothetical protein Sgly_0312 [Syntrophobotulus glycolicus DSM 8271]|uniref:Uncharacterized protein n=1 Tax=Syntrophobotulus glycolicus (strain DSM 8271 / FlGlyR) TaxID=645991 RepID=F0SXD3_SYNGF|nr:hypothetical protein [Syntrophobotulus glycolicus]ADY54679.1 hypothetical protein Sgly_0312 [Syntrophobotulus glycolicus DSM 8271]
MPKNERTISITYSGQSTIAINEIAEILARHITNGDHEGYLRKVAEKRGGEESKCKI